MGIKKASPIAPGGFSLKWRLPIAIGTTFPSRCKQGRDSITGATWPDGIPR
ncbi:hypothetical protein [Saccharicrinis sp. FJH54]|uniref:hypothetical protein n=1 Tax=Saccharicrinis sp. FJH54 TaxID=3344665 RepID=UPI0035D4EC1D